MLYIYVYLSRTRKHYESRPRLLVHLFELILFFYWHLIDVNTGDSLSGTKANQRHICVTGCVLYATLFPKKNSTGISSRSFESIECLHLALSFRLSLFLSACYPRWVRIIMRFYSHVWTISRVPCAELMTIITDATNLNNSASPSGVDLLSLVSVIFFRRNKTCYIRAASVIGYTNNCIDVQYCCLFDWVSQNKTIVLQNIL